MSGWTKSWRCAKGLRTCLKTHPSKVRASRALKGHGFSRATKGGEMSGVLAPERWGSRILALDQSLLGAFLHGCSFHRFAPRARSPLFTQRRIFPANASLVERLRGIDEVAIAISQRVPNRDSYATVNFSSGRLMVCNSCENPGSYNRFQQTCFRLRERREWRAGFLLQENGNHELS